MLSFKPIELSDRPIFERYYRENNSLLSEYCFANNFSWSKIFNISFAETNGLLVIKTFYDEMSYLFPVGSGDIKPVIQKIIEQSEGEEFSIQGISKENKALLETIFPDVFEITDDRNTFDYVYETSRLATLSGKKLHSKRNHMNRFAEIYPNYSFEQITPENIKECAEMNELWCKINSEYADKLMNEEICHVRRLLKNYFALDLSGGLIRIDGQVVAFSIGSRLADDCFIVHVEKALSEYRGVYQAINMRFVNEFCLDCKWVNREDDGGNEGLRKAKMSYDPAFLTEKYVARLKKQGV